MTSALAETSKPAVFPDKKTVSIPEKVGFAALPKSFNVSLPAPPTKLSPALAVLLSPTKVSAPEVPVKFSIVEVSEKYWRYKLLT